MKMNGVFNLVMRLLEENQELLDEIVTVEALQSIILNKYLKEVDKRQIGRALKKMGFYQENINTSDPPIIRRKSVYHLNLSIYEAARLKYVVKKNKED